VRGVSLGELSLFGERARLSLPVLLLAVLLFNAGIGARAGGLAGLARRPWPLLAGLAANLAVPVGFIYLVSQGMRVWHNPEEVQQILVGLALVASMPIAGSSAAWSQNADGDLALSLGLVLLSTLLSPLTTPAALHAVGAMASGEYAQSLHELASSGSGVFLAVCVALPSLLGLAARRAAGEARAEAARPALKLANSLILVLLNYSNACVSLPQALAELDWDFLAVILCLASALCVASFAAGWAVARLLRAGPAQVASLAFGLGMSNNGTGLVLASMALASQPRVLLPIIFYNLVQHLVAACVDRALRPPEPEAAASDARQEGAVVPAAASERG
jgi:BASS family bile acid:Na+ symporter